MIEKPKSLNTIEDLNRLMLTIDNDSCIRELAFTDGFLIWTRVRYSFFRNILDSIVISQSNDESKINQTKSITKSPFYKRLYSQLNLLFKLIYWRKGGYDIICFSSSTSKRSDCDNLFTSKYNHLFNKLNNNKILNVFQYDKHKRASQYYGDIAYFDSLVLFSKLKSKFVINDDSADRRVINKLFDVLQQYLSPLNINTEFLLTSKNELFRYLKIHYVFSQEWKLVLKKTTPKFIAIEAGNYGGGFSATIIYCSKQLGIRSVEIQHGVFDIAFFYGSELLKVENFINQKTDILLTFGKYWNQTVRIPGKPYAVGSLVLHEKLSDVNVSLNSDIKYILFVPQASHTSQLLHHALEISKLFKGKYKVRYKLHPQNYTEIHQYETKYKQYDNLKFEADVDAYQLLKQAAFVVGSFSTLLFESVYFGKVPIVYSDIFSDAYIPIGLGDRYKDTNELFTLLSNENHRNTQKEYYWEFDWMSSFKEVGKTEYLW